MDRCPRPVCRAENGVGSGSTLVLSRQPGRTPHRGAESAGDPVTLLADEPTGNLDAANGEAVMELLRELNRNGATICMVTHDHRYAEHAGRTVNLFDGRVVNEPSQ